MSGVPRRPLEARRTRANVVSLRAAASPVHMLIPVVDRSGQEAGRVKTSREVTPDKLRGGFYSPNSLVQVCLNRAQSLLTGDGPVRVLEPSAGDGAFIAGLAKHALAERVQWATAVEILGTEAAACRAQLSLAPFHGEAIHSSVLAWASGAHEPYDVAVGNPPFVRFQFVDPAERVHSDQVAQRAGLKFTGVSNLWLPILVAALSSLRPGGVFAFIIPAECFTGISGHEVREWLLDNVHRLQVDLFTPGSFPGVLQEVVVLSGQMAEARLPTRDLHMHEHGRKTVRKWKHQSIASHRTWTRFLLSPAQVASLETANTLRSVTPPRGSRPLRGGDGDRGERVLLRRRRHPRPLLAPGLGQTTPPPHPSCQGPGIHGRGCCKRLRRRPPRSLVGLRPWLAEPHATHWAA